jgi:uncharacterized membrane protein YeiB
VSIPTSERVIDLDVTRAIALIGVASILVATVGGPVAAASIAGPMYFLIGPFKWGLGWYSAKAHSRLEALSTADTSPE